MQPTAARLIAATAKRIETGGQEEVSNLNELARLGAGERHDRVVVARRNVGRVTLVDVGCVGLGRGRTGCKYQQRKSKCKRLAML